ncbi:cell division suppressor protein YneA [Bacillus thermotolerans]|uniref:ABC transport protein, sugar-binding component yneA n=1 Tax=Bacillus thermotolerans TaxID=1221996 RepID=A0A0F5I025_BACTR|nr:LysM peptidoglycan-binding domain-containing protein [Bacillus thermotolerans]KKB38871.1 ABC transport protein, sugar-binding component yneA [Bacillus thermotolerans]KKB42461.1 ABC transport protein, sugar-binding component yneA [Bacillus thermotolerans]KKB44591.1 ABC transport protein, sugar-binding component yneA [Bacillus thermotolerans]
MIKTALKENYYVLLLAIVTIAAGFMLISGFSTPDYSYEEVIVQKGDSLWSIADRYVAENGMNKEEFIKWIQEENQLRTVKIIEGDRLLIPISESKAYLDRQVVLKGE